MHHNASFSARSVTIPGGHGNQACYDINGNIITSTIAGGTADYVAGNWKHFLTHIDEDVNPFIDAVQIDGNPCYPKFVTVISSAIPTNFTRPCLYQGYELNKYFYFRPATPTGIQTNTN